MGASGDVRPSGGKSSKGEQRKPVILSLTPADGGMKQAIEGGSVLLTFRFDEDRDALSNSWRLVDDGANSRRNSSGGGMGIVKREDKTFAAGASIEVQAGNQGDRGGQRRCP